MVGSHMLYSSVSGITPAEGSNVSKSTRQVDPKRVELPPILHPLSNNHYVMYSNMSAAAVQDSCGDLSQINLNSTTGGEVSTGGGSVIQEYLLVPNGGGGVSNKARLFKQQTDNNTTESGI